MNGLSLEHEAKNMRGLLAINGYIVRGPYKMVQIMVGRLIFFILGAVI